MNRPRDFDVVIVGAGVVGATMAALLAARRLTKPGRVALLAERFMPAVGADADWDLRVFALSRASQRLLTICGVWEHLPAHRKCAYEHMRVWDAAGTPHGAGALVFDCAEIAEPNLGFIIDGRVLQWQCLQSARASGAVLIEGELGSIGANESEVGVRTSDGREFCAKLLIGADGTESRVRTLLGIDTAGHVYGQDALVAHVRTAEPHQSTAWQRFLGQGPIAFLPLADGRSSIVWSAARSEAPRLRALDAAAFGAAVTEAGAGVLGRCELTTAVASYPLQLKYAVEYARPRAVLLGDAAHVVHPLAGQGLNLGLMDCAALAEVLGGAGGAAHFGEHRILRRYERWRRSENLLAAAALDGMERLFSNGGAVHAALRTAALSAAGKLPFIKRRLAWRALGLSGDIPAFLRADRA